MVRAAAMAVGSPRRPDAAEGSEELAVTGVPWADAAGADTKAMIKITDVTSGLTGFLRCASAELHFYSSLSKVSAYPSNPTVLWLPSHQGLFWDAPQRHSEPFDRATRTVPSGSRAR